MRFTVETQKEIDKKARAFQELFERKPTISLEGTFRDSYGELVFFDLFPKAADSVGAMWSEVELDGEAVLVRPEGEVLITLQ